MRAAIDLGLRPTNHTDFVVTPLDQMFVVWTAVNRVSRSGAVIGADQRVTPLEALKAITINAARQYREDDQKGSLEVGKLADLVILEQQNRALQIGGELARTRWLLIEQSGSSIPTAFLVFLVFWVTMIFASFGLFAPCNTTVIAALFVCSVSIAGSIFLILEMDAPLHGLIKISGAPMHSALSHLNQ